LSSADGVAVTSQQPVICNLSLIVLWQYRKTYYAVWRGIAKVASRPFLTFEHGLKCAVLMLKMGICSHLGTLRGPIWGSRADQWL